MNIGTKIKYGEHIGIVFSGRTDDSERFLLRLDNFDGHNAQGFRHLLVNPILALTGDYWHAHYSEFKVLDTNRQTLNNFLKEKNINKSQASLMLGKSRCWLATMTYDSKRDDIKQKSLDRIIAALSIDWTSKNKVHVSTKGYVPYTTAPCGYKRPQDKARLMQAYLNGEVK